MPAGDGGGDPAVIQRIPDSERREWYELGLKMGLLTPLERQAMVYWASGVGYTRIAYTLGVPRETARGRIQRALTRINLAVRPAE